jgi:hypothetical protein
LTGLVVSDGISADDMLTDLEDANFDRGDRALEGNPKRISQVWISSDNLRKMLKDRNDQNEEIREKLRTALMFQLSTVVLYSRIGTVFENIRKFNISRKDIQLGLYVILFPGTAKDNTGLKDLNEKVIGNWYCTKFIRLRFDAIDTIFKEGDSGTARDRKFEVVAQTYKTAYILTEKGTREEFAKKLSQLDDMLRLMLLAVLDEAENDPDFKRDKSKQAAKQRKEIKNLRKKLRKKGYRFDIFFGSTILKGIRKSKLENVYLLVTESLKGVGIARYVAKVNSKKIKRATRTNVELIKPDSRKLDVRGKRYEESTYMKASDMGEKIKALFIKGYTYPKNPYTLNDVWVDTVWTLGFVTRRNLYLGNPDIVRDVRKKKLESPPAFSNNGYPMQKELLEIWLVILNLLDFVKRFNSNDFHKGVQRYHDEASEVFNQLSHYQVQGNVDWDKLEKVLTHDLSYKKRAVTETASEFQFYSEAADHAQRIFFSMDIRDMGVDLMLDLELSNIEIGRHRYRDIKLMEETFHSSDAIEERRFFTYDHVRKVFEEYYDKLVNNPSAAMSAAQKAFRGKVTDKLGTFEQAVQIMLGGDEVYIAAHPLFTEHIPAIIAKLDQIPYDEYRTLNMRTSIAFSSAENVKNPNDPKDREIIQLSHDQTMRIAEKAPNTLKDLERTHRRIERLIEMLDANDRKATKAPPYRYALAKMGLTKLFARVKYGQPEQQSIRAYNALLWALKAGDINAANDARKLVELVDFNGNVVDVDKLENDAKALEDRVRRDVGRDNVRFHPPPLYKIPKWMEKLLDWWADKPNDPKKSCLMPDKIKIGPIPKKPLLP